MNFVLVGNFYLYGRFKVFMDFNDLLYRVVDNVVGSVVNGVCFVVDSVCGVLFGRFLRFGVVIV